VYNRLGDLPKIVADYIGQDDLLSAYVVTGHDDMLVVDLQASLIPFETQIYNKTHPKR
jgi:hypothetical protein